MTNNVLQFNNLKDNNYTIELNNKIIGNINFYIDNNKLYLNNLSLLEKYQKQYYGTNIINVFLNEYNIDMIVEITTKSSVGFYEKIKNCVLEYNNFDDTIYFTIFKN